MRPVLAGLCKMESLKDGSIDLCDIADMNDALDVQSENDRRIAQWRKDHPRD